MIKNFVLIAICAIGFSLNIFGQEFRLQGTISDSEAGKSLENVVVEATSIDLPSLRQFVAISNIKGEYSITLPAGNYQLAFRIIGYNPMVQDIQLQSDLKQDFSLTPQPISLGEIVVSSFRVDRKVRDLPTPLAVVNSYEYQRQSALTLSNVLANEPGIAMGSDGVWATNINIRGLNENRLVTLVDGYRVETATDLTASLSMIDVNDIERVEVVKGAQSSLYGTGAMGGVVNIITKDGHFSSSPYLSGNVISGFSTANEHYNGHLGLNAGAKNWYVRVSGTYSDASDIRTPEGLLPNSQFTSNNISAKMGFKPLTNHTFNFQYQRYWANDVGIPGGSAFPGPATATYSNIGRQLLSASYEITDLTNSLQSLKISYFNQYILRDVLLYPNTFNVVTTATGSQRITPEYFTPTGEHFTQGAQLQSTWNLSASNTLIAGVDAWARRLYTEREKYIKVEVFNLGGDLVATNNLIRGETPNPGSTFSSAGFFAQNESRFLGDRLKLIVGGRLDGVWVENEQGFDIDYLVVNGTRNDTPPNQRITFEAGSESSLSWSANAGALYSLVSDVDLSLNLARSFRAPSLEERFKYIDLGNLVRLGDPTLNPESGYSLDMGLRIWKPKFSLQLGGFANWISDMIVEIPGEFIYTINTGPLQGVVDTLPALVNANVSRAFLYGADMGFQYNFYSNFLLFGSGSYVIGKDTEADEYLPQIPPFNGRVGMRYTYHKFGSAEFTVVGASKQDRVADGELATEGYTRFDIGLSTAKINLGISKMQLFLGVDNIMDKSYTNHLATNRGAISIEPGRNIYLRMNLTF